MCLLRGYALSLPQGPRLCPPTSGPAPCVCRPSGTQRTRLKQLGGKGPFFGQGLCPSPKDEDFLLLWICKEDCKPREGQKRVVKLLLFNSR
ncbi:hypothetical protein LEMLEM_LOCUS1594 [Lemmus lemmus]